MKNTDSSTHHFCFLSRETKRQSIKLGTEVGRITAYVYLYSWFGYYNNDGDDDDNNNNNNNNNNLLKNPITARLFILFYFIIFATQNNYSK